MNNCPYHEYYINQAGSGVGNVYRGHVYQKGCGIGSFLKGLFRSVLPLFKSGIKTVGKEAMRSGSYILSDLASERPLKESVKERFDDSVKNLKRKVVAKLNSNFSGSGGGGIKRRRTQTKQHSSSGRGRVKTSTSNKRIKNNRDIFHN